MIESLNSHTFDANALWRGLIAHVHSTMGIVGVPKMLGGGSDDEAQAKWVSRARPILERLAEELPLVIAGPALFDVGDDVQLQLGIHEAHTYAKGPPVVRTMMRFDPAPAVLAVVGDCRWGEPWTQRLLEHERPRNIVAAEEDSWSESSTFPWIAQRLDKPRPATVGASERYAMLGGLAEDLGFSRVAWLFREFENESRV